MKPTLFAIVPALALSAPPAFANGGGYFRGGVVRTGTIAGFEPAATGKVRILDEQLDIAVGPAEAAVEVRYLMRNETAAKVKVRFGFPVLESFDRFDIPGAQPRWKEPRNCRDYQVTLAGKPLKARFEPEPPGNRDPRFDGLAGWMVSEAAFPAGAEVPVRIRCRSAYPESVVSVSDDERRSSRTFRYRLSTGACWAGTIARGRVTVTAAGIDPSEVRVLRPVNRFRKEDGRWVWDFEDLEPTLADDLEIEAAPAENSYTRSETPGAEGPWVTYVERGGRWMVSHRNYQARASSTLRADGELDYDAANLNDDQWDNAWCEGQPGPGIGAWVELKPQVAKPLAAIEVQPGYAKSDALFKANARPKKVRVTLNGEHQFTAELPDRNESCRIPVSGYAKPVHTLRLTIEEAWKGTRHEDLCVSGISLQVRLAKKPEITPAR